MGAAEAAAGEAAVAGGTLPADVAAVGVRHRATTHAQHDSMTTHGSVRHHENRQRQTSVRTPTSIGGEASRNVLRWCPVSRSRSSSSQGLGERTRHCGAGQVSLPRAAQSPRSPHQPSRTKGPRRRPAVQVETAPVAAPVVLSVMHKSFEAPELGLKLVGLPAEMVRLIRRTAAV